MKRGRLPLTALRSFEAAGRLLSFKAAAEELFVSQAAISRQVRQLEESIGKPLFQRHHRSVTLTTEGQQLLESVTNAFDTIGSALEAFTSQKERKSVFVSVEVAFAANWLAPRLTDFHARHPDIEIIIDSDNQLIDLRKHSADLAIRFGRNISSWPDGQSRHLVDVLMVPVISPTALSTGPGLSEPADLLKYPLIHEDSRDTWLEWFAMANVHVPTPLNGPIFTEHSLILQSAARGGGAALADIILAEEDLAAGRLIRPFDLALEYGDYQLVARDFAKLSPSARNFASWIEETLASFNTEAGLIA